MKGAGFSKTMLKRSGLLPRASSSTSRKPLVVSRAVFAPLRSVRAFMMVVVPWKKAVMLSGETPLFSSTSMTPASKFGGVVWAFSWTSAPSSEMATRSVKVPPMSVATLICRFPPFLVSVLYICFAYILSRIAPGSANVNEKLSPHGAAGRRGSPGFSL